MKIRALTLLALLSAAPAWARIIVDNDAPEPAAEPGIQVPGPGDSSGASQPAAGSPQDTLSFLNRDQLHGILLGIDQNTGLRWQSPEARDPIVFRTDKVSQVKLDSHKPPTGTSSADRIALTNGDEFPGNIISLDDKALVLDTWYAGRLSIPRAMIRGIVPLSDASAVLYEGPTSMEGWNVGRSSPMRSWSFKDGALVATGYGSIGRDVKLPDMSSLEFDLVLHGNDQFSIGIYADSPDNFGNCYMLLLSNGYTQMTRYSRGNASSDLGSEQMQNLMRHDRAHIELRTNKDKKSIWLLVDGKMVKEWTDPAEFNGEGGSIIFASQPGVYVRISNIKVSKWNGKFDDSSSPAGKTQTDSVELANEDKVSGHLDSIQDGKARFSSDYAELSIPLERIEEVDLSNLHSDEAKPAQSDVRAYFPDGGAVTMQLTQWDAKGCTGSSPNFGTANFSPDAFTRIEFNLPAQQQMQDSDDSDLDADSPDQGDHE